MNTKIDLIRKYYSLIEDFNSDKNEYEQIYDNDIKTIDYPNLVSPKGQMRTLEELFSGMENGKKILNWQKFEINTYNELNEKLVVESKWKGEVALDIGKLKKGQILIANICTIFEFKDGKIIQQTNYDCYEAF